MRTKLVVAGLAALALLAGAVASPARAQQITTLFYQEVEKDGRIYVFNTPERFKSFSESGEIGTAITLIGKAEGGKTLVAENETAADLYLFKHDLPGYERESPKAYKPPFDVSWKDGKTTITAKNARIEIGNRVQVRYTQQEPEDGESKGSFRVRRAKFAVSGTVYEVWKFKTQAVWSGGSTTLEDAYIEYAANPMATVWFGQGKAWFGRQELTSSGSQQFVDRSIVSERFAAGRDQGVSLIGKNPGKTFEYNVGIYNGNGRNVSSNDDDKFLTVGRLVWTPFGEYKLEESALDYPSSPKLALGIAGMDTTDDGDDITRIGVEAAFKVGGFNTVAEYYTESLDFGDGSGELDTDGFYVQLGYLFPNKKFELAGRYATVSPDVAGDADETETGVAFSYYMQKHGQKLQADFRQVEDEASGTTDDEFRLQFQIVF
jgi:phosphate-selective porin